jgi:hypothetical protein
MGQPLATQGTTPLQGQVSLQVIRGGRTPVIAQTRAEFFRRVLHEGLPTQTLPRTLSAPIRQAINRFRARNLRHLLAAGRTILAARALGMPTLYGALDLTAISRIGTPQEVRIPYGLVSLRVVTTTGVGFICDAFQNLTELENMKYHALGTGSTAEDPADTALITELTTQYTGNVRATGNLTEGASANIFHTEATNTLDETPGAALREHGVFSAVSAGVLLDRSVYAAITLSAGDGLLSKYELTLSAGS